jgi:hypothetical protein
MAKESIKGIDQVVKELRKIGKDIEIEIDIATSDIANQISAEAKKLAPANMGKLRQSIYPAKITESNYKIVASAPYAAYMEFGTGGLINVPVGWEDLAIQFKGKGIKQVNIFPRPYLYPSYVKGKKDYLENLKKLLLKYNKKI